MKSSEGILVPKITVDVNKCTGCGTCVDNCPQKALEIYMVGNKKRMRPIKDWADICVACEYCMKLCPYEAVKIELPGHELW